MQESRTGLRKFFIYVRIAAHVLLRYRGNLSVRFVLNAGRLLNAFYDNKLIKLNNAYKLHIYLPAYPTAAFFKAVEDKLLSIPPKPISLVLSITKACSYNCPHCYQRLDKGSDMTEDKLLETVKNISDAGVAFLNIEGGDAFLRFDTLCKIMDTLGPEMEVWINTTGENVTKEKLQTLKNKGVCGLMVSLHGDNAQTHDGFVGRKDSFESAKKTLLLCSEVGLGSAINSVLTYEDIKKQTLEKIMLLAKELNCGFVQLIHPKRAGKWLADKDLYAQDKELVKYVEKAHKYYNSRPGLPALPAQAQEEAPEKFGCTCGGIDRFYIGASGEVQPCEFLNISFGNVNDEPFDIVFKRMRDAFKTPYTEWACAVRAEEIHNLVQKHGLAQTPVPYEYTKELVKNWNSGTPTKIYKRLKIYE